MRRSRIEASRLLAGLATKRELSQGQPKRTEREGTDTTLRCDSTCRSAREHAHWHPDYADLGAEQRSRELIIVGLEILP